jgi:hypothetical protein
VCGAGSIEALVSHMTLNSRFDAEMVRNISDAGSRPRRPFRRLAMTGRSYGASQPHAIALQFDDDSSRIQIHTA